jgi:hypothetical protein
MQTHAALPGNVTKYIERVLKRMLVFGRVREGVRKELVDHFEDALVGIEDEAERIARAQSLIEEFGDEETLAALIRQGKWRAESGYLVNVSGVVGIGLFVSCVLVVTGLYGIISVLVSLPALTVLVGCFVGMGVLSFGAKGFLHALWATRSLVMAVPPGAVLTADALALRGLVGITYGGAAIGAVIGLVVMLYNLEHPPSMGAAMAFVVLSVLYATALAEGTLRPALRHVETILSRDSSEPTVSNSVASTS